MFLEARKIHLIEEVLKVTNEATLTRLEGVLKKSEKNPFPKKRNQVFMILLASLQRKNLVR